jgi:MFS family permease
MKSTNTKYKNYLLILLMVILAFNFVDLVALGVVLQNMKADLHLTDTQLGFLSGIAYALFYSVMGVPIARWADRGDRVTIISITALLRGVAVALSGAAANFVQLFLIRIGVAVGEVGCIPAAQSLISDNFPRAERPRAVARFMLGIPLAMTLGYFAAGWVSELYGWRATFVVLGLPSLGLAALARSTLLEPRRVEATREFRVLASQETPVIATEPSFKEVAKTLWVNAAFRHLLICFSVWYFFGYGIVQWTPAFFIRSHGLRTGELGTWFAAIYGIGGGLGVYFGGELASRFAAGNERLQLRVCAAAFVLFAVLTAGAFATPNHYLAFATLALAAFGGNMAQGPVYATIQTLVPPRMRAMSIALVLFFANLVGTGLGPWAAGALSDVLRPWLAEESLRYSLVLLCPGYFWAAWHLWRASRTVASDVANALAEETLCAPRAGSLSVVE